MKHLIKFLIIGAAIMLISVLAASTIFAQGGEGGIVIAPNQGDDVATMNPILANDTASGFVINRIFPDIINPDPATGVYMPGTPGSLATDWTISDDGLVYTFTLRDDMFWTDGTPVTSADYLYAFRAVESGLTSSPRGSVLDFIASVEAPDPQTVVITFNTPACNNIDNIDDFGILPAHLFQELVGDDFAAIDNLDFNLNPTVTSGMFSFGEFRPGEQVSLIANQDWPDASLGFVNPAGLIYKNVPDQNIATEQFLAGELSITVGSEQGSVIPPERFAEVRERAAAGDFQTFQQTANGYSWLAWNAANPDNPLPGVDEDGNPIEQDPHPILGDPRVRVALAHAVDVDGIIAGAAFGEATRVVTHSVPSSWAFNQDIEPIPFDPDTALAMLAEAGWVDDDNDPSTPLVATEDALYAEPGTPFEIEIITNADNPTRVSIGTIVQDQLGQIGVAVDFQAIDFNVAVERTVGQTFDGMILGWSLSFPDDPDFGFAFNPENDVPGAGFNFVSYNNPEVTALLDQANNLPGCDQAERAELYKQAQALLAQDQPYLFLFSENELFAAQANVEGFDPFPNQPLWNLDTWNISQ